MKCAQECNSFGKRVFIQHLNLYCILLLLVFITSCEQTTPQVQPFDEDHTPETLSQWRLFIRQKNKLILNSGVTPYVLKDSLFTDYAQKFRTVWLPVESKAQLKEDGHIEFPIGTIISKTFYYPLNHEQQALLREPDQWQQEVPTAISLDNIRLLETRLLIHQQTGWQALPYVWNEEQTEAYLALSGDWINLSAVHDDTYNKATAQSNNRQGNNPQAQIVDYIVPDANQCSGCHAVDHSAGEPIPIGPKARHLNLSLETDKTSIHQLEYWHEQGLLASIPQTIQAKHQDQTNTIPTLADKARAYLDINCGHCHNKTGAADTSGLFLDIHTGYSRALGLCKPPVAAGKGSGNLQYAIVPGDPEHSILVYRMNSLNPAEMMPELGRSLVHQEGVQLIQQWISHMDGSCQ